MPDDTHNFVVSFGNMSKPADTLVKKVFDLIGDLYQPWQIKRIAQAQKEAGIIKAQGEIEVSEIQRRALVRFIHEQGKHQSNMEEIISKAIPQLRDSADAAKVDDDWIVNFFDKCRKISDEEMQNMWAKVLAGEVNEPGKFSKRTVNVLADMDRSDAEAFTLLCSCSIYSLRTPLIYFKSHRAGVAYSNHSYLKIGLTEYILRHLHTIGLIVFDLTGENFYSRSPDETVILQYFEFTLKLRVSSSLPLGNASFTKAGLELAQVVSPLKLYDFVETLRCHWKDRMVTDI